MKKNYISITALAILLSFLTMRMEAQTFSILGAGTSANASTGYPSPYGNWYWGAKHQMFVTAAELTSAGIAGGAQISSIGFNISNLNGAAAHQGWTMKVFTTTNANPISTTPTWFTGTAVAQNVAATITGTVGWNQTTFSSPFIWNGSDNLVIETCFNNSSYTYNYSTYYETALTGTSVKTMYRFADNATNCGDPSVYTSTTIRPNMRFEWISPTPCAGTPGANSVVTPTYQICPNSGAAIGLASSYTLGGLTYQWQSSTVSPVGPFTNVTGATSPGFSTPNLTVTTFYQAVITCTNTAATTTAAAGGVTIAPVTTDIAPYYESFEGIIGNNTLPNCSWAISNQPNCLTYTTSNTLGRIPRTGTKFASFYYNPAGARYFYTNGIYLNAGITYSAALWYETEYYGYTNWSDLSIMVGPNQTTTGLVTVASTNGPAVSNIYKSLSNTFTVATSGIYYVAIRATATSGSSQYLTWDDLSITIPCTPNSPNTPTISLTANTTTICTGDQVNLTAGGADTYTWSTGSNAGGIVESPLVTTVYNVVGTNTITGCMSTKSETVIVNETPVIFVIAGNQNVCSGSPVNLTALGGSSYVWSNGSNGANITVSPTVSTTYTVLATGSNGCTGSATQLIGTYPLPSVTASSNRPNEMCPTETAILTAAGTGVTYQWTSNVSPVVLVGNPVNVSPSSTTIYTVTATDANGCQKSSTVVQNVINCTGVNEHTVLSSLNTYPNPTTGEFSIESNNTLTKSIEIIDVAGKVVSTSTSNKEVVKLSLKDLSNGIYYVKIRSNSSVEVIKVVKQ